MPTSPSSSVTHATHLVERVFDATPAQVFAAWAEPAMKARWSIGAPEWSPEHQLDFRVGGSEYYRGEQPDGPTHEIAATFLDIVPDERIVYAYDVSLDGERILVSLATIALSPVEAGTRLVFTEQSAVFEDDADTTMFHRHMVNVLGSLDRELRAG